MPYYSIIMVSIGSSSGSYSTGCPSVSSFSLQVSVAMPYYRIVMVSICSSTGFSTGSPSVSPSLQVSVAMPYYGIFNGFNRLQFWLLAQGLLQSVLSLQVSVLCYTELLWYSTCIKPINPNLLPIFQLIIAMKYIIITLYCIIK